MQKEAFSRGELTDSLPKRSHPLQTSNVDLEDGLHGGLVKAGQSTAGVGWLKLGRGEIPELRVEQCALQGYQIKSKTEMFMSLALMPERHSNKMFPSQLGSILCIRSVLMAEGTMKGIILLFTLLFVVCCYGIDLNQPMRAQYLEILDQ